VEENLAYSAFLIGKTLLGMRVADVLAAVRKTSSEMKPRRIVLCGRRDAALTALFAAAVEPQVAAVATEEMQSCFASLFSPHGRPINGASILPGLLRDFGDIADVVSHIGPRPVLIAAPLNRPQKDPSPGERPRADQPHLRFEASRFSAEPKLLIEWLAGLK
jgi:hypothetical protein